MKNDYSLKIKKGDKIGCFYTNKFIYLIINKELCKYRLSHKSLKTYTPLIYIDHDEIEFEVIENIVHVDENDAKFDFLNYHSNIFYNTDINESIQKKVYADNGFIKEKEFIIGQQVLIDKFAATEKN